MPRVSDGQRAILSDLAELHENDCLYDNFWSCYLGYNLVIASLLRRGWADRPQCDYPDALRITETGRKALRLARLTGGGE